MLVNYYYVCIRKHWINLKDGLSETRPTKKNAEAGCVEPGDRASCLFGAKRAKARIQRDPQPRPASLPASRAPLQTLLPHYFVQRFFVRDHIAQPGRIVHLAARDRTDLVERLARAQ